jgi:acyl-CoA synthetase (AMP-forming)/AMP-acid ligase II
MYCGLIIADISVVTTIAALSGIAATASYLDAKFHIRHDLKNGSQSNAAAESMAFIVKKQSEDKMLTYHCLEWWAKQDRPDHLFLEFDGSRWTYKQFYLEVQRVGNWLMNDLGIQRDEVVALDGRNSCSYVLLWMALEAIGACPAFINSNPYSWSDPDISLQKPPSSSWLSLAETISQQKMCKSDTTMTISLVLALTQHLCPSHGLPGFKPRTCGS